MKKIILSVFIALGAASCDDGDIITQTIEFDSTYKACGELVLYKTKSDPSESLSLQLTSPTFNIDDLIKTTPNTTNSLLVDLVTSSTTEMGLGTSAILKYRSYNTDPSNLFCNDVPPTNISITQDQTSNSGSYQIFTTLIEDDNDGIPSNLEDLNGNGNLFDDDTDNDGLPNFMDDDDDGDNVKTISENSNYTANGDLSGAQDTDGDNTPDYLDNDDDNDGILTINEESVSQDLNPLNDITSTTPDYLNSNIKSAVNTLSYSTHEITQKFEVNLKFSNISFESISYDTYDFGNLEDSKTEAKRTVTPKL